MTITTKQLRNLGGAAAVFLLLVGTADAQQMKAVGPEPGQCKTAPETILGNSPQAAQINWQHAVAAKFGANWARWPAAQNKVVANNGSATSFYAQARPCFTYPVQ
jgi:hypothetical protein